LKSSKPKNQRLMVSRGRKAGMIRAPLSSDLNMQYGIKTVSIRKGDTVSVTRGDYAGHEGKVVTVAMGSMRIVVEGINQPKLDGTNKPVLIPPSKVKVTKLDLSDKERKKFFDEIAKSKPKE